MRSLSFCCVLLVLVCSEVARGEVQVTVEVRPTNDARPTFKFDSLPAPSDSDAGNLAKITLLDGRRDRNAQPLTSLVDGELAAHQDDPQKCFFFSGDGGRVMLDLGRAIDIKQVNTYSWHTDVRSAQVYTLWVAGDDARGGRLRRVGNDDPARFGWIRLADVDSHNTDGGRAGQVGVGIADPSGQSLGNYRYLLLDVEKSRPDNRFGNTFFTEIDVVDGNEYPLPEPDGNIDSIVIDDNYEITFDTTGAPELRGWVDEVLKPVCREWYPKIVAMLPSENYEAPTQFTIYFRNNMDGVAYTQGRDVHCAGVWFSRNLQGEAAGAVVHELCHVVQQYRSRRNPSWLVEGVCDYIRWFLYEPEDQRPRVNFERNNYDDSYRVTGAFLNYVVAQHGEEVLRGLNTAMRQGRYSEETWKELTGKTAPELWAEFGKSQQGG